MNRQKNLIHITLWTVYLLTYALLWNRPQYSFLKNLTFEISQLPFKLVLVYAAIYLADNFLFKNRFIQFLVAIACLSFLCGIFHQLYMYYVVDKIFPELNITSEALWDWGRITKRMTFLNTPMLIALTLVVLNKYFVQKNINTRISNEKLSAELKLLKNQLHPHFFFNTLNNLYSLSLQKSELAPVMILKLSDLMRYTLDQADKEKVMLDEEIAFIKNYVAIEEIRYKEKVTVKWDINIDNPAVSIPPLILSTFIENAFKHGIATALTPVTISIELYNLKGWLHYTVINSIPARKKNGTENIKPGTGLSNLQQRLDLIYKKNYIFKITENSSFKAYLSIPLDNENL